MLDMNDPQAKAAALASRLAAELKAAADEYPPVIASHAFVIVPQARDQQRHVLQVEGEVRRAGGVRGQAIAVAGGREPSAEEAAGRGDAGQRDAEGWCQPVSFAWEFSARQLCSLPRGAASIPAHNNNGLPSFWSYGRNLEFPKETWWSRACRWVMPTTIFP